MKKETSTSGLKGVNMGLTSLCLQCLGIETMPYIIDKVLFKSIPTAISSIWLSSFSFQSLLKQQFDKENEVEKYFCDFYDKWEKVSECEKTNSKHA